jgi:4-hydroxybenzoate polyprenyltransferase
MGLGILLAFFLEPMYLKKEWFLTFLLAVAATCLVASSNYVINEILDAPTDKVHPQKKFRPIPSGNVNISIAYIEWMGLSILGLAIAYGINWPFFLSAVAFWVSGILYNVPPIRTKDVVYLDVISESINNPIRLFLGWFAIIPDYFPPLSAIISYWMVGAFFMGSKRLAEYRMINDAEVAGRYRASFRKYTSNTLIIGQSFYSTSSAFFFGIFIIRYHLELILAAPLIAGFYAYFVKLTLKHDSPVKNPEKLYKEFKFIAFTCLLLISLVALLFIEIPVLYDLFNVIPNKLNPMWSF